MSFRASWVEYDEDLLPVRDRRQPLDILAVTAVFDLCSMNCILLRTRRRATVRRISARCRGLATSTRHRAMTGDKDVAHAEGNRTNSERARVPFRDWQDTVRGTSLSPPLCAS